MLATDYQLKLYTDALALHAHQPAAMQQNIHFETRGRKADYHRLYEYWVLKIISLML